MVIDIKFLSQASTSHSQAKTEKTNQKIDKTQWLEKAESFSLVSGVVGSIAGIVYQQTVLSTVALSLSLYLHQLNNRRRLADFLQLHEATMGAVTAVHQHSEANTATLTAQVQAVEEALKASLPAANSSELMQSLEEAIAQVKADTLSHQNLEDAIAQVKKDTLPRQALAAITFKIHQLNTQSVIINKSVLPQLSQSQQSLANLENQVAALQKQLSNLNLQTTATQNPPLPKKNAQPLPKRQRGRVAIFIDAANLYHALVEKKWEIDYAKLLNTLTGNGSLVGAYFYTGKARNQPNQDRFFSYLHHLGYKIIDKEVVQFSDGSKKANLDVELALDLVNLADTYDTAVLVSGDGDFTCAVKQVQQKQARVEVVSFQEFTSKVLIKASDRFVDLDTIENQVCKNNFTQSV